MNNETKFDRIDSEQDKHLYFTALIREKSDLFAILADESRYAFMPGRLLGDFLEVTARQPVTLNKSEGVFNFLAVRTQLFFKSRISQSPHGNFIVDIRPDLYQLQRRGNFRVKVTPEEQAVLTLATINQKLINISGSLVDLSLGGCLIEVKNFEETLSLGDYVTGVIQTPITTPIEFHAVIRHMNAQPGNVLKIGLEFQRLLAGGLPELNKFVMDLYRKYFLRTGSSNFSR